jgi:hypothetical protein
LNNDAEPKWQAGVVFLRLWPPGDNATDESGLPPSWVIPAGNMAGCDKE